MQKKHDHHINWEDAKVVTVEQPYLRRRVQEAIRIRTQDSSMNLDCGLFLSRSSPLQTTRFFTI